MRALRGLTATDIQPRQLTLQWEPLGYNLTRCHTYTLSLCYRYSVPTGGGGGGNNATVRECLSVERNTSRFTLRDLPPFHSVHVRLALANPEGKKEGREVTFQTEEDSEHHLPSPSPLAWPLLPRPRAAAENELIPVQETGGIKAQANLAALHLISFH